MADEQSVFVREGKHIKIKGEDVHVFDPPFRKVLRIGPLVATFLPKLADLGGDENSDNLAVFGQLLADDEVFAAFRLCASTCTNKPEEFFDDIALSEVVELVDAARVAVNWESLKRLFPQGMKMPGN